MDKYLQYPLDFLESSYFRWVPNQMDRLFLGKKDSPSAVWMVGESYESELVQKASSGGYATLPLSF